MGRTCQIAAAVAAAAIAAGCGGSTSEQAPTTAARQPPARPTRTVEPGSGAARRLARRAAAYRRATTYGLPVARILPPGDERRLVVFAGFDQQAIDRGPGWYEHSHLPGEGRLIYVAGHNRTHGGPFHAVASARRGDPIVVSTPYATARYTVVRRRQESERDVGLLRPGRRELLRLQTSTYPPSHRRWIVDARLDALIPAG